MLFPFIIILLFLINLGDSEMIPFLTDCDGTLVHYEGERIHDSETLPSSAADEIITLPASAGSGSIGSVSRKTLDLLASIAAKGSVIVCVSGMRAETMRQRAPFFPSVHYWICENGGRIFHQSDTMHELEDWQVASMNEEGLRELARLKEQLRARGLHVDDRGYRTMIRVKGSSQESLGPLSASLSVTGNLGHVDVQVAGLGKLAAGRWLLRRLELGPDFLFMGDDDNDVEALEASVGAFVCSPCSAGVRGWVDKNKHRSSGLVSLAHPLLGHRATEHLLCLVLSKLERDPSDRPAGLQHR